MNEFKEEARSGEEAFVHLLIKGGYVFIQWSDSENGWDYYIADDDMEYKDGGQFLTDGDGAEIENAYDALSTLLYDEYGIYDIDDDDEVEFLDPEERYDIDGF